ncbi:MAG: hypothetical protein A2087_02340 [Spirochaetes bacterium GWD1_61_31]|nr:MAG: hypothetical protein A2Y37_00760 [Spirochaetes bacterium GWB1_60_80]OHD34570.1 MAG: hypothetical protein A2004_11760 [Spirochaetes bacterium GWC1_61_12]OHD44007.1 MAG: hypothetical protein A2087_02340 [Spirochaetes bacterium GWD1_61_31]OHD46181.1 MAG: hypothetical protein A2Y35_00765 [Spirochaetes bacterium GWE1_60_18]OHD60719.1 MAG: hypothetical protein A2Y32_07570 [Spirochaetes bacterium GWF1_60_12]HAP43891.1 hypothetical protein [Spirochaetaceae bacterium]
MSLALAVTGTLLVVLSGLPGLLLAKWPRTGQVLSAVLCGLGSLVGLAGAFAALSGVGSADLSFPWLAVGGAWLRLDALSAFFLVPIYLVAALGSLYGLGYWPQSRQAGQAVYLQIFWGLLVGGMALLVLARQGMAFLFGWELMALSAFFLVSTDSERIECRNAGWIYLLATHVCTLTLFVLFVYWRSLTGSFEFSAPAAGRLTTLSTGLLFTLCLLGFGMKAGLMPLHFWLPGAHAVAPSHVSAMMSGVLLTMGVYGFLRMVFLLGPLPPVWGGLVLAAGLASALIGIVLAANQSDLKRLLAYSSVENVGIIFSGIGLAMLGRWFGQPRWVLFGLGGALLHVWNHAGFKPLLFFAAGGVLHAAGTRDLDRLGGLAKHMPFSAALFALGAIAACALPPLNGFISEFILYHGFLEALGDGGKLMALVAVPIIAIVGAVAIVAFVKAFGGGFLGLPRSPAAAVAHEAPLAMRLPMAVLAVVCLLIGLFPDLVLPMLERAMLVLSPAVAGRVRADSFLPPFRLRLVVGLFLAISSLMALWLAGRRRQALAAGTWDCGYARPDSRMQYTASSFSQAFSRVFTWLVRVVTKRPAALPVFPLRAAMDSKVPEPVLDGVLYPAAGRVQDRLVRLRRFQHGLIQSYVLYVLVALFILLATLIPFGRIAELLFPRL